jgi:hypothetical protein
MFKLTAKLRDNAASEMKRYGSAHYTITTDEPEYPYSLGYLKVEKVADAMQWTVYNLARQDIGFHSSPTVTFADRDAAIAHIRDTYTAAHERYRIARATITALIHEGLSPVRSLRGGTEMPTIIMEIIDAAGERFTFRMLVTVQEALTAMDYLTTRSQGRYIVNIIGFVATGQTYSIHRHGFAKWQVPAMGKDYQIAGWESTTGEGRRHTDAFRAAISKAA